MKKKRKNKVFKRLACVFGACAFALVGCLPFIPMTKKASAEGNLTNKNHSLSYHNPFSGAVFSQKVQFNDGTILGSPYMTNSLPDTVYYSPTSDSSIFVRESYLIGDNLWMPYQNSYYFTDIISAYGNNFQYKSQLLKNTPVYVSSSQASLSAPLLSFSFSNLLLLTTELDNLTFNFRYMYMSENNWNGARNWVTTASDGCRLEANLSLARWTDNGFVFDDISNPFTVEENSFPFYSTTSQGYKTPFANYGRFTDYIYTINVDGVDYSCYLVSGNVSVYPLLKETYYSVVNSSVEVFCPRMVSNETYNLSVYQKIYNEFYYGRFEELALDRLELNSINVGTKILFDTIENVFSLEIFPGFKLYMFFLIGLGGLGFALALKILM